MNGLVAPFFSGATYISPVGGFISRVLRPVISTKLLSSMSLQVGNNFGSS